MATFTPPTVEARRHGDTGVLHEWDLQSRGLNLYATADGYSSVRPEGVVAPTYLGAHEYVVSDDEVTALTASGYGAYIVTEKLLASVGVRLLQETGDSLLWR